jgi:endonuclease YncB( thermonuclease family)
MALPFLYQYRCRVGHTVDGDTVDLQISLGFGLAFTEKPLVRVRLADIQAPEKKGATLQAGKDAQSWTMAWVNIHSIHPDSHPVYPLECHTEKAPEKELDRGRRWLARLSCVEGHCLNDDIIAAGHAVVFKMPRGTW